MNFKLKVAGLLLLALFPLCTVNAQVVGSQAPGSAMPTEIKAAAITSGALSGNVNLTKGAYETSYNLGTIKTPSGISFTLSTSYNSTVVNGSNVPLTTGISYGEGWSLNIPSITISTAEYIKYSATQLAAFNRNGQYDVSPVYNPGDYQDENNLYWFAPQINIPGVISERFVFKDVLGSEVIFVPHKFDSYIEARFNGSRWKVILSDGTTYTFETAQTSISPPTAERPYNQPAIQGANGSSGIPGDYSDSSYTTIQPRPGNCYGCGSDNMNQLLVPRAQILNWYCDFISSDNAPTAQQIQFNYSGFGVFNFYNEFAQDSASYSPVRVTVLKTKNGYNYDFNVYKDILLKDITAFNYAGGFEKLALKYHTIIDAKVKGINATQKDFIDPARVPEMLVLNDSLVHRKDSLYNYQTVYSQIADQTGITFSGWTRYKHPMSVFSGYFNYIDGTNPFICTSGGIRSYLTESVAGVGINGIPFSHGFLESGRIKDRAIIKPGDTYELRTEMTSDGSGPRNPLMDINISSGPVSNISNAKVGSGSVDPNNSAARLEDNYNRLHKPIYNTFGNGVKWHFTNNVTKTSSFFVMPNMASIDAGLSIQVGPANSDNYFAAKPADILVLDRSSRPLYVDANKTYFDYIYQKPSNQSNLTAGKGFNALKPGNKIPSNFGIGLPWHMLKETYDNYDGLAYKSPDTFWYNDGNPAQGLTIPNTPTLAGNGVFLKKVELIRYSKNPYMLTDVEFSKYNGTYFDFDSTSTQQSIVSRLHFTYDLKTVRVLDERKYTTTSPPALTDFHTQYVFLLASIKQYPTNPSRHNQAFSFNKDSVPTTQFKYKEFNTLNSGDSLLRASSNVCILTKTISSLGKETNITYVTPLNKFQKFLQAPDYDRANVPNPIDPLPSAVQIVATVQSVEEKSIKQGTEFSATPVVQSAITQYAFSNLGQIKTIPSFTYDVLGGYKTTNGLEYDYAYQVATVTDPVLKAGQAASYSKYYHFIAGESSADLLFGLQKSEEHYDGAGTKLSSVTTEYKISTAFYNGIYNQTKGNLDGSAIYIATYDFNPADIPQPSSDASISMGTNSQPFLETYSTGGGGFSLAYLNSFFFRKIKETASRFIPVPATATTAASTNQVDNVTEYAYYDMDLLGQTDCAGMQALNQVATPLVQLTYEPSWQLYSTKAYSPQMPGASSFVENFYYHDLVNQSLTTNPLNIPLYTGDKSLVPELLKRTLQYGMRSLKYQQRTTITVQGKKGIPKSQYYIYDVDATQNGSPLYSPDTHKFTKGGICNDTVVTTHPKPGEDLCSKRLRAIGCLESSSNGSAGSRIIGCTTMEDCSGTVWVCPCINESTNPSGGPQDLAVFGRELSAAITLKQVVDETDTSTIRPDTLGNGPIVRFISVNIGNSLLKYSRPLFPFDIIVEKEVLSRNYLGLEEVVKDANGMITRYYHSIPTYTFYLDTLCHGNSFLATNLINIGYPVAVTQGYGRADSLRTDIYYNGDFSIDSLVDPNGGTVRYKYDVYGRPAYFYRNNQLEKLVRYHYFNNDTLLNFAQRAAQNYTQTDIINDVATGVQRARSYVDVLGREYETASQIVPDTIEGAKALTTVYAGYPIYDKWNREVRRLKGFTYTSATPAVIIPRLDPDTMNYTASVYENDSRSRLLQQAVPGQSLAGTHTKTIQYLSLTKAQLVSELSLSTAETTEMMPCTTCAYIFEKTTTTDEDAKVSNSYTDALGRTVATKSQLNALTPVITLFFYDEWGNNYKVINPSKQVATTKFNMLGWPYQKQSVDAGLTKYLYSPSGKVVWEQDQKAATATQPYVRIYEYDLFDRLVVQKRQALKPAAPADLATTNRKSYYATGGKYFDTRPVTFIPVNGYYIDNTTAITREKELYYGKGIAFANAASISPRLINYVSNNAQQNLLGKLQQAVSYNNTGNPVQYSFYSYDKKGQPIVELQQFNPNGIAQQTPGLVAKITYAGYNNRGSLLTQNIDINNDDTLDLQHHYVYDAYNRLSETYTNYDNSKAAGNRVAGFVYNDATGLLVKQRYYAEGNTYKNILSDSILYVYDIRDRVTTITSKFFNQALYYDAMMPAGAILQGGIGGVLNLTGLVIASNNYNGNINGVKSQYTVAAASNAVQLSNFTGLNTTTTYGYRYDNLNRLTDADATVGGPLYAAITAGDESYTYDKIGNITNLSRYNVGELQNYNWSYTYTTNTNRLASIGGVPVKSNRTFMYDVNGNLSDDASRGITAMDYGRANLPFAYTRVQQQRSRITGVVTGQTLLGNEYYLYNASDQRVFKLQSGTGITLGTAEFYLNDLAGQSLGVISYTTGKWNWYLYGGKRLAKLLPDAQKQPALYMAETGNIAALQGGDAGMTPASMSIVAAIQETARRNTTLPDDLKKVKLADGTVTYVMGQVLPILSQVNALYTQVTVLESTVISSVNQLISLGSVLNGFKLLSIKEILANVGPVIPTLPMLPGLTPPTTHGGDPLLKGLTYFVDDYIANLRVSYSTNVSATKAVTYTLQGVYDYYPAGRVLRSYINGDQDKFLYTGKERDVENGLDYFGARMYDSDISRFLSLDPLARNYVSLSPYSYVAGNPIVFVDNDGRAITFFGNGSTGTPAQKTNSGYTTARSSTYTPSVDVARYNVPKLAPVVSNKSGMMVFGNEKTNDENTGEKTTGGGKNFDFGALYKIFEILGIIPEAVKFEKTEAPTTNELGEQGSATQTQLDEDKEVKENKKREIPAKADSTTEYEFKDGKATKADIYPVMPGTSDTPDKSKEPRVIPLDNNPQ